MKFEEFDFKRAIKSEKAMNAIAAALCAVLWASCIVYMCWSL